MEDMTSRSARRVRAIAVVAVLLCGFATIAPLIAQAAGAHHERIHVVKVVGAAVADQHSSTVRLDQPGATLHHARETSRQATASRIAASLTPTGDDTVDSARTRGPPTSAL
jgi:TPP-dependent 2-oxoacid decarboxylase